MVAYGICCHPLLPNNDADYLSMLLLVAWLDFLSLQAMRASDFSRDCFHHLNHIPLEVRLMTGRTVVILISCLHSVPKRVLLSFPMCTCGCFQWTTCLAALFLSIITHCCYRSPCFGSEIVAEIGYPWEGKVGRLSPFAAVLTQTQWYKQLFISRHHSPWQGLFWMNLEMWWILENFLISQ